MENRPLVLLHVPGEFMLGQDRFDSMVNIRVGGVLDCGRPDGKDVPGSPGPFLRGGDLLGRGQFPR